MEKLKKIIIPILIILIICAIIFFIVSNKKTETTETITSFDISDQVFSQESMDKTLQDTANAGYVENFNTDYTYSNDIGAKVSNVIQSDNDLRIWVDFDFSKNKLTRNSVIYDYIVYDENNKILGYENHENGKSSDDYLKDFCNEHGITFDESETILSTSSAFNNIVENENKISSLLTLSTNKGDFPKSQKIYIDIIKLTYSSSSGYKTYNDANWHFELDLSEKTYNRISISYKLKENIEGLTVDKINVTDTSTLISYTYTENGAKVELLDANGNKFEPTSSTAIGDNTTASMFYSINKNNLPQTLYLKLTNSFGQEIGKAELEIEN